MMKEKRFYAQADFADLVIDIQLTQSFQVDDLLEYHLDKAENKKHKWLIDLKATLVEAGFSSRGENPKPVSAAFQFIQFGIRKYVEGYQVKNQSKDSLTKPFKQWTENDYEVIVKEVNELESLLESPKYRNPKSKKLKDLKKIYKDDIKFFKKWKELYEKQREAAFKQVEREYKEILKEDDERIYEIKTEIKRQLHHLKRVNPPIINDSGEYALGVRKKASLAAFINALKFKGLLQDKYSRKDIAKSLNVLIKNLNLGQDGKTLDDPGLTTYNKYYKQILNLLNTN